jgi:Rad3-related DNA helicase
MDFDLDLRTARLSVGEFAHFTLGPRDSLGGASGPWRAQLGTHWHQRLHAQTASENASALFEVPIAGRLVHHGWTLMLAGRLDQIVPAAAALTLREIKTVTRELPVDEAELRADYPEYFAQLATYAELARRDPAALSISQPTCSLCAELHFVEIASGLAQTVVLSSADALLVRTQLERICEFLDLRHRARARLRTLRFRPPFADLRPGQQTTQAHLTSALTRHPIVFFEAPTGFGKTGALLELALGQLRAGRCERLIYLTSKATGQLQVMRTLSAMTAPTVGDGGEGNPHAPTAEGALDPAPASPVAAWLVRPKREHCVHTTFHCSRDVCPHLAGAEARWPKSGLSRFYLFENEPRDLESLRAAGRSASICPYEITRAALSFNDVWIGDYNYVFSPSTRGLFHDQPGFDPARTLLVVDEAHNLPARVADAYSHTFTASDAAALVEALHRIHAPSRFVQAAEHWSHFLRQRAASDALPLGDEEDARDLLGAFTAQITATPLDTLALGPALTELLWAVPSAVELLNSADPPRLWWSPRAGEIAVTCLDAAAAIAQTLRAFGGVVLASATLTPAENFASACGLGAESEPASEKNPALLTEAKRPERLGTLNRRDTKNLFKQLTSGGALLAETEARIAAAPTLVRAVAPWREGAYDVAVDARVDTTYRHRTRFTAFTAETLAALHRVSDRSVVAFFPSYAYAEAIQRALAETRPDLCVALQPRLSALASQTAWAAHALTNAHLLFLVLGGSFAEGIDLLGGRVSHALVAGPALPEVNAVQRARLDACAPLGRDEAFRRVYQIPGIQKVNQALGRLVRAPGQKAKVLLHCRRFAEPSYTALLAPEYRGERVIASDSDLLEWL